MTHEPFTSKGKQVLINPLIPGDGAVPMHPAMIVPDEERPTISGEPITEQSHEFVVKMDKNAQD
jgi:hypothetical protein